MNRGLCGNKGLYAQMHSSALLKTGAQVQEKSFCRSNGLLSDCSQVVAEFGGKSVIGGNPYS